MRGKPCPKGPVRWGRDRPELNAGAGVLTPARGPLQHPGPRPSARDPGGHPEGTVWGSGPGVDGGGPCKLSCLTWDLSADPGSVGGVTRTPASQVGMCVCTCVYTRAFHEGRASPGRLGCEPTSSRLPAVGPGQTVSSEPGFHHFTWKDLKAPRCCRARTAAARRRRKLPAIWKKEQGSHSPPFCQHLDPRYTARQLCTPPADRWGN